VRERDKFRDARLFAARRQFIQKMQAVARLLAR
jgi:hypothetical protein